MASAEPRSLDDVRRELAEGAVLWCLPRFRERAARRLGATSLERLEDVPRDARTLVVVGGGTWIDEAKLWRRHERPDVRLVAVPSRWGSGAEASGICAVNRPGGKHVEVDPRLRPDARAVWPELAEDLSRQDVLDGCGDALSHALEGFASPLATDEVRAEGAALLGEMIAAGFENDVAWFGRSARACALQERSSVGLVHGIAHTLEGRLPAERRRGHARLCRVFLAPVLAFDLAASPVLAERLVAGGIEPEDLERAAAALFDADEYRALLPFLIAAWRDVLRDPCTRTNVALVRPGALEHFRGHVPERGLE